MIVIGYLYNNNGMATWCIEVSKALHKAGYNILLVHTSSFSLPHNLSFQTMVFDMPPAPALKGISSKYRSLKNIISAKSNGFSYLLYQKLKNQGKSPEAFFLNQSDMLDKRVPIPQFLCAWVYPSDFHRYLLNALRIVDGKSIKTNLLTILSSIGFYYKDHTAYRNAAKVLSLTPQMHQHFIGKKIDSFLLSPCYSDVSGMAKNIDEGKKKVNLLISALDLDSRRKNIPWMLEAINDFPAGNFKVTLIGNPGDKVNSVINKFRHEIEVKGQMARDKALALFGQADIFLFASTVDDWGYVLVEAMMNGLVLLVPDKNPYNYIAGNERCLFKPGNKKDFLEKLGFLINSTALLSIKAQSLQRADSLFSGESFATKAKELLNNHNVN